MKKKNDVVNHPSHYAGGRCECIDFAENLGFCLGNAFKYVWRSGKKGGIDKEVEDLQKAIWYVKRHQKTGDFVNTQIYLPLECMDDLWGDKMLKHMILNMILTHPNGTHAWIVQRLETLIDKIQHTPDWREAVLNDNT